jgi:hypothetical protein
VLPFENLSGDAERVLPTASEETIACSADRSRPPERHRPHLDPSLQAHPKSLAEIGLSWAPIPDGGVDPAEGTGLRITSRLVRVRDQTQVWSAFATGSRPACWTAKEISTAIAEAACLSPERLDALAATRASAMRTTCTCGAVPVESAKPATNSRAIEYYERAIVLADRAAVRHRQRLAASPINATCPGSGARP